VKQLRVVVNNLRVLSPDSKNNNDITELKCLLRVVSDFLAAIIQITTIFGGTVLGPIL